MLRTTLALVSLVTLAGLFAYPVAYVTFPWTVPVPYMLAIVGALCGFVLGICR